MAHKSLDKSKIVIIKVEPSYCGMVMVYYKSIDSYNAAKARGVTDDNMLLSCGFYLEPAKSIK